MSDSIRNLGQNSAMWPALTDIAAQVGFKPARWRGDVCVQEGGYCAMGPGVRAYTPDDWKDILTALWKLSEGARVRYAPLPDGQGIVALGLRTSKLSRSRMSEFLDFIHAFGAEYGVRFTAPKSWGMEAAA